LSTVPVVRRGEPLQAARLSIDAINTAIIILLVIRL
jgi:hypothetical protein